MKQQTTERGRIILNHGMDMCKYIFERYLLSKVYFTKIKDWSAFKLNNCICQKIPFIFWLTHIYSSSAICTGENNFFTKFYNSSPVGITVEGSNTLTIGLIIFGLWY